MHRQPSRPVGANPDRTGQADTVTLNATNGADVVLVAGSGGAVTVTGLAVEVTITGFDTNDRLVVNGLAADDVVKASPLAAALALNADGGDGDDVLIGGGGFDFLNGGAGDNVVLQ